VTIKPTLAFRRNNQSVLMHEVLSFDCRACLLLQLNGRK
jgi:hypothetical protein